MNFVDPDGLCAFRMVGGIGLVVAWGLIINGADNLVAGAYSMIAGEEISSLIQGGFRRAIPNRTAADLAYMGFEIGLNVAGLSVERAAQRAATQVAGQVDDFGDVLRRRKALPRIDEEDAMCLHNVYLLEKGELPSSAISLHVSKGGTARKISGTGLATRSYVYKFTGLKNNRVRLVIDELEFSSGRIRNILDEIISMAESPVPVGPGEFFNHPLGQF